ncbi:MAG: HK97-gp10 family putative phage morphogenesis protein [Candidatus Bathyarchaeia archaeon]
MSVEVAVEVVGGEEFAQAIGRFDSAMQAQVKAKLAEWAETVRSAAERLVPVRTGYLRSTIYARSGEWQAEVGAEAAYATCVEFGTRSAAAKPFLQPAVERHLPEVERLLVEALESAGTEVTP